MLLFMGFGAMLPSFGASEKKAGPGSVSDEKFPDADYFTIFDFRELTGKWFASRYKQLIITVD